MIFESFSDIIYIQENTHKEKDCQIMLQR